MFLVLAVGLYTSRVVLGILGGKDYGLYNIVGSIVVLFGFLQQVLNNATYWNTEDYIHNILRLKLKHVLEHVIFHIFKASMKKYVIRKTRQIELAFDYDNSNKVITWCGQNRIEKEIHLNSWMGDGTKMKFENIMLNIPSNYDAYLKCMYCDYMKLPPKEDQVSHHYVAYLNMDKRETLTQVLNKIG